MKIAVMLRAVNLAGRRLTMDELRAALAELGHREVRTVVATGNAVFEAPAADAAFEDRLEKGLGAALGAVTDVFVRHGAELAEVVAQNPYADMARDDPSHLLVMFLRGDPAPDRVAALQAKIAGREQVAAGPRCLYACFPDGVGTSKVTSAMIERALGLRGTGRNWNTVAKLAALTTPGA